MFYVINGVLEVLEKDKKTILNSGEFYIVKKGIEHRVIPKGHVKLILFEPKDIEHTGKINTEITKNKFEKLYI